MTSLLYITCSVRGDASRTAMLANAFLDGLKERNPDLKVTKRDVGQTPPAHPDHAYTVANYTPADARTDEMVAALKQSDELIDELHSHDTYLFAVPMYNYSVPSTMKAWIDNVVRIGRTFQLTEDGRLEGLLEGKKALFVTTRGVPGYKDNPVMQGMDFQEPYLETIFGLLGVSDVTFESTDGLDFASEEAKAAALENAKGKLSELARSW